MTFKPGNTAGFKPGQGGRAKGARNVISTAFLEALAKHFQEEGHEAIEIVFHERPAEYLKIVAAILPKEFEITNTTILSELPDADLELLIAYVTRVVGGGLNDRIETIEGRADETANGEQASLLSAVPETT